MTCRWPSLGTPGKSVDSMVKGDSSSPWKGFWGFCFPSTKIESLGMEIVYGEGTKTTNAVAHSPPKESESQHHGFEMPVSRS
jgi:hypothetical protein